MNQTIEIIVSPTGRARVQTRGFSGDACRDASKFLEDALGRNAAERLTAEFYQQQTPHQQEREGA